MEPFWASASSAQTKAVETDQLSGLKFRDTLLLILTQLCWLVSVTRRKTRVIWEEETLTEEMPLSDWPVSKPVGHFLD